MQFMKVMLVTSSLTSFSKPRRTQASWVNALSWWEVKLKLLLFKGSSIGAVEIRRDQINKMGLQMHADIKM